MSAKPPEVEQTLHCLLVKHFPGNHKTAQRIKRGGNDLYAEQSHEVTEMCTHVVTMQGPQTSVNPGNLCT